jgi:hypothetical protein
LRLLTQYQAQALQQASLPRGSCVPLLLKVLPVKLLALPL